jgi:hypothetical protein
MRFLGWVARLPGVRRYWPIILFAVLSAAAIFIVRSFVLADDGRVSTPAPTPNRGPFVQLACLASTAVTAGDLPCQLAEPVMSVEELRGIVASSGFTEANVRVARSTDSAPVGSLLYAVPVVDGRLIASVAQQSTVELVGRLSSGALLAS